MKNILNYKFGFYLLIVILIGIFVIDSIEEDYDDDEITKAQVKEVIVNFFSSIEIVQLERSQFLETGILSP